MSEDIAPFCAGKPGWLKRSRLALFLSTQTVADRLKVIRTAYSQYEQSEERGSITLASLAKAAEAMDCELVYAIRPKNRACFSSRIWKLLMEASLPHQWLKKCDQKRRANALAHIANQKMKDPRFKLTQGWSKRAN